MYVYMPKIISLSEESYEALSRLKNPGESFSEVVKRLAIKEEKRPLSELAGSWKISSKEARKIAENIYEDRKKFKAREL